MTRPEADSEGGAGASRRALRLIRMIDRMARAPGRYVIVIDVPVHRRAEWSVEVARYEALARLKSRRE